MLHADSDWELIQARDDYLKAATERDRYKRALLEVADVYHDSVLTNAQAQDKTIGIVRGVLGEVSS